MRLAHLAFELELGSELEQQIGADRDLTQEISYAYEAAFRIKD